LFGSEPSNGARVLHEHGRRWSLRVYLSRKVVTKRLVFDPNSRAMKLERFGRREFVDFCVALHDNGVGLINTYHFKFAFAASRSKPVASRIPTMMSRDLRDQASCHLTTSHNEKTQMNPLNIPPTRVTSTNSSGFHRA
jgi:hypothetical protein